MNDAYNPSCLAICKEDCVLSMIMEVHFPVLEATLNKRHLSTVQVFDGGLVLPGDRWKEEARRNQEGVTHQVAWQHSADPGQHHPQWQVVVTDRRDRSQ